MHSSLALPSAGGELTRTLTASPTTPATSDRLLRGCTRTSSLTGTVTAHFPRGREGQEA
jgi:hypothetical protein